MKYGLLAVRNYFDFFLRNQIRISRSVSDESLISERDRKLQIEFQEFFNLFNWKKITEICSLSPL
jgi:hypothetical protein